MMDHSVLEKAISQNGKQAQILKCVEEMGELITELMHWLGGKSLQHEVADEVADVLITANQMRLIFGEELVDSKVTMKLNRLNKSLDKRKQRLDDEWNRRMEMAK